MFIIIPVSLLEQLRHQPPWHPYQNNRMDMVYIQNLFHRPSSYNLLVMNKDRRIYTRMKKEKCFKIACSWWSILSKLIQNLVEILDHLSMREVSALDNP